MEEFKNSNWSGGLIQFNFEPKARQTFQTSGVCLNQGMTGGIANLEHKTGWALYHVILWKTPSLISEGDAYYCPFTRTQVIQQLEEINELISFRYSLIEEDEFYHLFVAIDLEKHPSPRVHLYVWTRIRYLWEFPQSALFHDVFRLKEQVRVFKDMKLNDIYSIIVSTIPTTFISNPQGKYISSVWYQIYHSIPVPKEFIIDNSFKVGTRVMSKLEKENALGFYRFNDLQHYSEIPAVKIPGKVEYLNSFQYWMSNLGFLLRAPYYIANLERLKNGDGRIEVKFRTPGETEVIERYLDKILQETEDNSDKEVISVRSFKLFSLKKTLTLRKREFNKITK